jgi:DNA repair photolyase
MADSRRPFHGRGTSDNPPNRFERLRYEQDPEAEAPPGGAGDPAPLPRTELYRDSSRSIIARNESPDVGFEASINPYRGCEHGCVYCLSGDTPILMAGGSTKLLAAIRAGERIHGTALRGGYRRYVTTRVLAQWAVEKPAYRVTLEDGTELIAGGDHRFLTERGWKYVAGADGGSDCRPRLTRRDKLMGIGKLAGSTDEDGDALRATRSRQSIAVEPARRLARLEGRVVKSAPGLRVAAVEPIGVRPLFDITTGTGDFIADGVVSHNCYARPTHEYLGFSSGLDFETKILVKEDAPELLRRELSAPGWKPTVLALSGVTDPYQPAERRLRLTRRCLEVLAEFRNPVAIVTKSHLVTRDVDLLKELARWNACAVFVSVTTLRKDLVKVMEPRASSPEKRLQAIRELADAGIPAGVMVAPVIPGLTDHEIPSIIDAAAAAGARRAGYVVLRLPHALAGLFETWLEDHFPGRKQKVLNRIRAVRGGKLNDPRFGSRMRGEGAFAEEIASLFRLALGKAGIDGLSIDLSTSHFRRPGYRQLTLFDDP